MVTERIELGSQAEEKKHPPYADLKTHQFFLEAIAEGAHESLPARQRNIVGIYFGTDLTLEEIGRLLALKAKNKKERPRQIITSFIRRLRRNCSEELQQKYKLSEIKTRKPASLTVSERKSAARGGKRREIRELISSGVTKRSEIAKLLNVSRDYVSNVFTSLRKKGLGPESLFERKQRIREQIKSAQTDEEIREALAAADLYMCRHYTELFTVISKIAREVGFRFREDELVNLVAELQNNGVPFRLFKRTVKSGKLKGEVLRYYFVLRQQEERVKAVFRSSDKLAKFKRLKTLKQIAGPKVELPSTSRILQRDVYVAVGEELKRLKGKRANFLLDCSVPVFKSDRKYLVASEDFSVFAADLEEFRRSLQV